MGRTSEVIYYPTKRGHFTTYKGTRYRLSTCDQDDKPDGPNYLAALAEFARVMSEAERPDVKDDSVVSCIDRWLDNLKTTHPVSHRIATSQLESARKRFRGLRTTQLTPRHILDYLAAQTTWGLSTKTLVFGRLKSVFAWSKAIGDVSINPIADMKRPDNFEVLPRGEEYAMPDELVALLIARAREPFKSLLLALSRTGARPIELYSAEWWHFNPDWSYIRYEADARRGYVWKNARKKKTGDRSRTIYLDDECAEIVRRRLSYKGFLFVNRAGQPWNNNTITRNMNTLKRDRKVREWLADNDHNPKHVIPYGFRHTWITNAIKKGKPIKLVADLCGTSTAMIEKHYSHASADHKAMREFYLSCL